VLCGLNLHLQRGRVLGVVGPTGAGKSSLAKLMLRYYDPMEGRILVNGRELSSVTLDSWRGRIGYVSQEAYLFYGTVAENISLGSPQATEEDIRQAAHMAGAGEFIDALPQGYETLVGDRGMKLSGGQRQRISLARAILRDPEFLILDEATSSVDTRTEEVIQNNLKNLRAERITLAISAPPVHGAALRRDRGGRGWGYSGVERGTHDELVAASGVYAGLWHVQSGE
jgi:ATP-binding cassette, subfamily B, bacterial